ncbi:MAG: hypothetical protein L3J33_10595 [Rhodobacteraceae bacterium]|nr:hypothetical protein [Paracoccaceae bacterium]
MIRLGLLLIFLPGVLVAQTEITVRSGEHDTFSRLVLTIDPDTPWELVETRGVIRLVFPDQMLDFKVETVFDRIPKTRLTSISGQQDETGSVLEIETPCACAANVFAFNENYLVIDIQDGAVLPALATRNETPPPAAYAYWQPSGLAPLPVTGQADFFEPLAALRQPPELIEPAAEPNTVSDLTQGIISNLDSVIDTNTTRSDVPPDPEMLLRVEEAQDQLLQQLTRAADQGLLDFIPPDRSEQVEETPETPEILPAEEEQAVLDPELLQQLSARTAYDDAAASDLAAIVNAFAMPQCLDDDVFDMTGWAGELEFSEQVAAFRSNIYGEFDRVAEAEVENLAKLYLAYGLGVEAISTLAGLPEMPKNGPVLIDMAQILDRQVWQAGGPISKGENCGGAHEMWFLAGGTEPVEIFETQAIVEAFSRYPIEIRLLIGPGLANALLDAGAFEPANQVLEIIRRAAVPETTPMQMVSASLLETDDRQEDADQLYQQVAEAQEPESPEAVIALARSAISQNSGIAQSLLTDLQAIVFEQRGTAIGAQARLWEIRVDARINGLASALNMVAADSAAASGNPEKLANITAEILVETVASQQGNLAYVTAILEHQHLLSDAEFADPARIQVANQLVLLGLPNIALDILAPTLTRDNPAAQQSAARAYLAQFQPEQALKMVVNLPPEQSVEIALSAHLLSGNVQEAAKILGNPAYADFIDPGAAWRAGDWQNVSGSDDDQAMAQFMQGTVLPMENQPGQNLENGRAFLTDLNIPEQPNLQTARDLLMINRASRAFIEDALGRE